MYRDCSTSVLYVPIDFGKNVNWFGGRSGSQLERVWEDQQVLNNRTGYTRLVEALQRTLQQGQFACVQVGYEPTGIYHEAWIQTLQEEWGQHIELRQVHPGSAHAKRQELQHRRPRKSDPIDLEAISACLRDGLSTAAPSWTLSSLRFEVWASRYGQVRQELVRAKQRLGAQLDRLWPGLLVDKKRFRQAHPDLPVPQPLVSSRPWERQLLRLLVDVAPNPHDWLGWSRDQRQSLIRKHLGRCGPKTLDHLQHILEGGLYLPLDRASVLAERLQSDFKAYQALETRLQQLEAAASALVSDSPAAVLTSIPGMSDVLAARYVGHVGPVGHFGNAAQVWAFAGLEPSLNTSGDQRSPVAISQQGAPAFRDTLFLIGFHTLKRCPAIGKVYRRALQRGKARLVAVLHAAHKANRLCFHLYTTQQRYDPQHAR